MRDKIIAYLKNENHYWWTISLLPGLYAITYLYTKNYYLVNSWYQFAHFFLWMIVFPSIMIIGIAILIKKQSDQLKNFIYSSLFFILTTINLSIVIFMGWRWKALILSAILILVLSWFLGKHYKKFQLILAIMVVFGVVKFGFTYITQFSNSNSWVDVSVFDNIELKQKPNIYLIQPDGYASKVALKNEYYKYDNSSFYDALSAKGFMFNHDYRSNYGSTLTSNATLFTAQHHYYNNGNMESELPKARELIMGKNPVLNLLKNNGYRTTAVLQHRYLLLNHPEVFYDRINIKTADLTVLPNYYYDANYLSDFKQLMREATDEPQFYFIEILEPSHITGKKNANSDQFKERDNYIKKLTYTNSQLLKLIKHIEQHEPKAIIIIAADHGGYVGYNYTEESMISTTKDIKLKQGIFGSLYAIKSPYAITFDSLPNSSINLFPRLFNSLSESSIPDRDNSSYQIIKHGSEKGVYKYYDDQNKSVLQKVD